MDLQSQIHQIHGLDDESLLRSLKRHVGSANRLNAWVLAHLAEVDARGAYRQWASEFAPARDVPALIQPLAAGARAPLRSDWAAVAESSASWVRELVPGDGRTHAPSAPDA